MADDWEERIKNIAGGLLTLEVNTIEKPNMSASKMPDVPLALHDLVSLYGVELNSRGFFVTDALLAAASARLANPDDPDRVAALDGWSFNPKDKGSATLTNGPQTFEALAWTAVAARRQLDEMPSVATASTDPVLLAAAADRAMLQRITTNCRQLRQVTLLLKQQYPAPPGSVSLFDGTVEQVTGAMFQHPRPALRIDTDVLMLIRKAWDIGLETVLFQTAMQVDGDVLLRVAQGMDAAKRDFYSSLHRSTVETGIRQWSSLFDLVGGLITGVGKILFQRGP